MEVTTGLHRKEPSTLPGTLCRCQTTHEDCVEPSYAGTIIMIAWETFDRLRAMYVKFDTLPLTWMRPGCHHGDYFPVSNARRGFESFIKHS